MPLSSNPPIHSFAFAVYPFISLGNFDRSVSNAKRKKNRVKYSAPCAQACSFVRIRAISYSNISGISSEVVALSVRRCISVAPLKRPPFRFRSRRKRKIGCSFARGKIRFPFEFLHLNEARRIRGRKEGNGNEARIHAHVDKYAHNCISNSLARTTVVLTPSSRPCYSPPFAVDRFLPLFSPGDRLGRWFIYFLVFRAVDSVPSLCSSSPAVVSLLRPFRSISFVQFLEVSSLSSLDDDRRIVSTLTSPRSHRFPAIGSGMGPRYEVQYSKVRLLSSTGTSPPPFPVCLRRSRFCTRFPSSSLSFSFFLLVFFFLALFPRRWSAVSSNLFHYRYVKRLLKDERQTALKRSTMSAFVSPRILLRYKVIWQLRLSVVYKIYRGFFRRRWISRMD